MARVYDEIVDFIARGSSPDAVVAFQPSEQARIRVLNLIRREREGSLPADEASELAHYLQYEHLMRTAKARARLHLVRGSGP